MFLEHSKISGVYLHLEFVDFRKGILGLSGYVSQSFSESKKVNLFIFCNKARNKLRILYWDDTGFALWHKALEKDKFKWPRSTDREWSITVDQLKWLLSGMSIETHKVSEAKAMY